MGGGDAKRENASVVINSRDSPVRKSGVPMTAVGMGTASHLEGSAGALVVIQAWTVPSGNVPVSVPIKAYVIASGVIATAFQASQGRTALSESVLTTATNGEAVTRARVCAGQNTQE